MFREFKDILKKYNLEYKDISEYMGMTLGSFTNLVNRKNGKVPRWIKMFILGYKLGIKTNKKE